MRRFTRVAIAAALGLAVLAGAPALAQQPAPGPAADCPYHDQSFMPCPDRDGWMGSAPPGGRMRFEDHSDLHASMSPIPGMMGAGNMTGSCTMMGRSGER